MVFNIKEKIKPKIGDKKIINKFAIFPVKINSTTIIWLERYFIQYELLCEIGIENFQWVNYKYWKEIDKWI